MEKYNLSSGTYKIRDEIILKKQNPLQIELIREAGVSLTEKKQIRLAEEMKTLFESKNWLISSDSFLFSIKRATRIILLRREGELVGSIFAGKRKLWNLFDFYYTERLILKENIQPLMIFFLVALLLYSLPEFLVKPILAVTLTRLKIVEDLLSLFGQNSISSGKDWPRLHFWEKWMVRGLVDACIGEYYKDRLDDMFDKGVIRNIFSETTVHDGNKAIIPELSGFSENDVLMVMSWIPPNMKSIIRSFEDRNADKPARLLGRFMKWFKQGALFERI